MQFQTELPKTLGKFGQEPFGIRLALEANHDVVRVPHDDHIAMRLLSTPCLSPQIEGVMEIDIRQQRRRHSPYTKGNFDRQSREAADCRLA